MILNSDILGKSRNINGHGKNKCIDKTFSVLK